MAQWARRIAVLAMGACALAASMGASAQTPLASHERLRQETILKAKARLEPLLEQYCRDACTVIDVVVDVDEAVSESDELGFEGLSETGGDGAFVSRVAAEIQVDDRVGAVSRERLQAILRNNLAKLGAAVEVVWLPVAIPQIGQSGAKEEALKRGLEQRVTAALEGVIATYCPEDCVLSSVVAAGRIVTPDEAQDVAPEELVRSGGGDAILRVQSLDVVVGMSSGLSADARARIANVMKAKTRFAAPLKLDVQVAAFPESFAKKEERLARAGEDPYGLERLRRTLAAVRDITGARDPATGAGQAPAANGGDEVGATGTPAWQLALLVAGVVVVLGVVLAALLRIAGASRDARVMMMEAAGAGAARTPRATAAAGDPAAAATGAASAAGRGAGGLTDEQRQGMARRVRNAEAKEELIKVFLDSPRVAKETFARLLQEEGVEETARYVHIFGHLVVFELLGDPNLQRDLYELSEYYHKSEFDFSADEEHRLLVALKTRVTASEIRVLARKQMEQFDFLSKLDSTQVYNLVADERPQVQSIVLTQLDYKRRRAVFDLYAGQAKVDLMRELCRADAIPKEYLANVAKALHKKVQARPEFDTENLRSSDILLDLLEKASLSEQRSLMANLAATNAEAARGVKLRLVTVEILPYLKDGHLLDVILGLEREDVLVFLAGAPEHIRTLLLSKAPEELAEGWLEDLQAARGASVESFRLVEMKVLGRIRILASSGAFSLLDVNDLIFGAREGSDPSMHAAITMTDGGEEIGSLVEVDEAVPGPRGSGGMVA